MKKLFSIATALIFCTVAAVAQNSTSAPQFQVTLNFLGAQPYSQSAALSSAFTYQFTTNSQFRADVIAMPGAGYTGYLFGPQYDLCGIKALENLMASTSLSCGKFQPYINGGAGLGQIQQNGTTNHGFAGLARIGANYDPTGSGVFTLNLFEGGWGDFGPALTGQTNRGWFYQTGISVGLGSSASASQAKTARIGHANAKKLKKINDVIIKARAQKV